MTDIAVTSPVERIARVIAADLNAPKAQGHANAAIACAVSGHSDHDWKGEVARALAVLRTLREPTPEMVDAGRAFAGDPAEVWNAMVRAAIDQAADEFAH